MQGLGFGAGANIENPLLAGPRAEAQIPKPPLNPNFLFWIMTSPRPLTMHKHNVVALLKLRGIVSITGGVYSVHRKRNGYLFIVPLK